MFIFFTSLSCRDVTRTIISIRGYSQFYATCITVCLVDPQHTGFKHLSRRYYNWLVSVDTRQPAYVVQFSGKIIGVGADNGVCCRYLSYRLRKCRPSPKKIPLLGGFFLQVPFSHNTRPESIANFFI